MLNNYSDRKKHYILLILVLFTVFFFQLWMNNQKKYVQFNNGSDFLNYATLGRQLVEYKTLPTFLYPGKTFDGPVKPFAAYFLCLIFGYHEWIPVFMISLYSTLICLACYFLARLFISRSAGLMAMALVSLLNPYIANYAFQFAYGFDLIVLFDLSLAVMTLLWVRMYWEKSVQPGFLYCAGVGILAGLAWYTHPTCISALAAVGIFLLLSMGAKVFSWRAIVVAISAVIASLPFWVFTATHRDMAGSWQGYSEVYSKEITLSSFLFSKDGYICFLLSPTGVKAMMLFISLAIVSAIVLFVRWLIALLRRRRSWDVFSALKSGVRLPMAAYGFIAVLSMMVVTYVTSGMTKRAYGWLYGIELWFWFVIAGTYLLEFIRKKSRVLAFVVLVVLMGFLGTSTVQSVLKTPRGSHKKKWEGVRATAFDLYNAGHITVLSAPKESYAYFALGPSGLNVTSSFDPWVKELSEFVECAEAPAVIADLNSANLGVDAWVVTNVGGKPLLHSFEMPHAGIIVANSEWSFNSNSGEPDNLELMRDDSMSTSWVTDSKTPELEIVLGRPMSICRLSLLFNREGKDWTFFTYPRKMLISGKLVSGEWIVLADGAHDDGYFWDGGRIFFAHQYRNRLDVRFDARELTAIRIQDRDGEDDRPRVITELYIFEKLEQDSDVGDLADLLDFVKRSGAERVLADRYVSAQILKHLPGVNVWKPRFLIKHDGAKRNFAWPWFPAYQAVEGEDTLIVSELALAPRTSKVLSDGGFEFQRKDFEGFSVFVMEGRGSKSKSDLVWNGMSVCKYFSKLSSGYSERQKPAVATNSFSKPVVFKDVATLLGVDVSPSVVKLGDSIELRYYWKLPHRWQYVYERPMVFSHLVNGEVTLSDDHRLLTEYEHKYLYEMIDSDVFVESRRLKIPTDAALGVYKFEMGLHFSGKRVRPASCCRDLTIRKDAVWFTAFEVK